MALEVGTTLGPYKIAAPLGAGGMGEVWRAHDTTLDRDVAIKVLPEAFATDADRLARFEREAKVLASLNHTNIGHIYGLEQSGDTRALVLELVDGPTLADRIAQGPIPLDEALPIAKQIAEALEAAHEAGVIHRDLKPANIEVTPEGTVKVLDFGLAKALEGPVSEADAENSPTLTNPATRVGIILGTAAYMSPEQAKGRPVDRRSDIWAFGAVLYEMLTGQRAFPGEDVSESLAKVIEREPDWAALPATTPPAIQRLLRRSLSKDRTRRLSDAADARLEIEDALSRSEERAIAVETALPRGQGHSLPRAIVMSALVAVSAAAGWLAASGWNRVAVPAALREPTTVSIEAPSGVVSAFTRGFALSPDGRTLVLTARTEDGQRRLWTRRLAMAEAEAIRDTEGAQYPFWSPDGRHVAFFADGQLKRVPLGGGPVQVICDFPENFPKGSWGDAGDMLLSGGYGRSEGIFKVPSTGGTPVPVRASGEPP